MESGSARPTGGKEKLAVGVNPFEADLDPATASSAQENHVVQSNPFEADIQSMSIREIPLVDSDQATSETNADSNGGSSYAWTQLGVENVQAAGVWELVGSPEAGDLISEQDLALASRSGSNPADLVADGYIVVNPQRESDFAPEAGRLGHSEVARNSSFADTADSVELEKLLLMKPCDAVIWLLHQTLALVDNAGGETSQLVALARGWKISDKKKRMELVYHVSVGLAKLPSAQRAKWLTLSLRVVDEVVQYVQQKRSGSQGQRSDLHLSLIKVFRESHMMDTIDSDMECLISPLKQAALQLGPRRVFEFFAVFLIDLTRNHRSDTSRILMAMYPQQKVILGATFKPGGHADMLVRLLTIVLSVQGKISRYVCIGVVCVCVETLLAIIIPSCAVPFTSWLVIDAILWLIALISGYYLFLRLGLLIDSSWKLLLEGAEQRIGLDALWEANQDEIIKLSCLSASCVLAFFLGAFACTMIALELFYAMFRDCSSVTLVVTGCFVLMRMAMTGMVAIFLHYGTREGLILTNYQGGAPLSQEGEEVLILFAPVQLLRCLQAVSQYRSLFWASAALVLFEFSVSVFNVLQPCSAPLVAWLYMDAVLGMVMLSLGFYAYEQVIYPLQSVAPCANLRSLSLSSMLQIDGLKETKPKAYITDGVHFKLDADTLILIVAAMINAALCLLSASVASLAGLVIAIIAVCKGCSILTWCICFSFVLARYWNSFFAFHLCKQLIADSSLSTDLESLNYGTMS